MLHFPFPYKQTNKQTNSVALSLQANYTNWATATCRRSLVSTFVDRGVSHGQRSGSLTFVNLSFLDRLHFPIEGKNNTENTQTFEMGETLAPDITAANSDMS
jgi:hypothetical protein